MLKNNFFVDCTDLLETDLNTGIQRVARNIIDFRFSAQKKLGISIQPVYYNTEYGFIKVPNSDKTAIRSSIGYLYSVRFCLSQFWRFKRLTKATIPFSKFQKWIDHYWQGKFRLLLIWPLVLTITPIIVIALIYAMFIPLQNNWKPSKNDILIVPGSSWWTDDLSNGLKEVKANMGRIVIIIYDLIPLMHPEFFKDWLVEKFTSRLPYATTNTDLFVAISQATEKALIKYLSDHILFKQPTTTHFLLGADLDLIVNTLQVRENVQALFSNKKPYLCVGTIEPRKNHELLLDAFDEIWKNNQKVHLCIIGGYGWKSEKLIERINNHPNLDKNLTWFSDLNDTELSHCYNNAKALIFPSIIEGFGLPLIEALHYGCPVMASDIPVFREIGGDRCSYFSINSPDGLINEIRNFETSGKLACAQSTGDFQWISWEESALEFYKIIVEHFGKYESSTAHKFLSS